MYSLEFNFNLYYSSLTENVSVKLGAALYKLKRYFNEWAGCSKHILIRILEFVFL